jgi:hypothetical protein
MITWHGLSCSGRPSPGGHDVLFVGEKGMLGIRDRTWIRYDPKGKELKRDTKPTGFEADHLANFVAAVRSDSALNSPIPEAHKSTLLCHLGNIAHRTGKALVTDPANGHIVSDPAAQAAYWKREYAAGFEPTL